MIPVSTGITLLLRWFLASLILIFLAFLCWESFRIGNQEVLYLFVGLLAVVGISGVLSAVAALCFRPNASLPQFRWTLRTESIEGGYLCPEWAVWFAQPRIKWMKGGTTLPVDISLNRGREFVSSRSRMAVEGIEREISVTDWTGLFLWRRRGRMPGRIQIDPSIQKGKLTKDFYDGSDGDLESLFGKATGDVTDSRFYQSGDSVRRILWTVVAKQGGIARAGDRLMVRTEEKVTSRRFGLFFLPGGKNDELAAGFARACIEKNVLGDDWVFSTPGLDSPLKRDRQRALASIDATGGIGLPEINVSLAQLKNFISKIRQGGIGNLFVILDASHLDDESVKSKLTSSSSGATFLGIVSGRSEASSRNFKFVEVVPE